MNKPIGKNQQALMSFLFKHPHQWHSVKGRKAIDAMKSLSKRYDIIVINKYGQVYFDMPQWLIEQAF
jgi:hypothetical protein